MTVCLLLTALTGACTQPESLLWSREHHAMGSFIRITVSSAETAEAKGALERAFREFDRLDALFSVWKPGSEVIRINDAAGLAPVSVSPETLEVLQAARRFSEWTDGKFDVTFGALSDVWKFDHDQDNGVPTAAEIAIRAPLIDYQAVHLDVVRRTVFLSKPRARIHLGGIGKGDAIDRVTRLLREAGLNDFMIQAGGDLYAAGHSGDGPWRVGLQDPRGEPDDAFATINLQDETFSTSGDYERFFIKDGIRYHHLLDPDTGQPARGVRSVTIVAKSATQADGLSTGVFLLGSERGMALVERLPDVEAVIVTEQNQVLVSSGLQGRLRILRAPTP